jgi:hypothetical protein
MGTNSSVPPLHAHIQESPEQQFAAFTKPGIPRGNQIRIARYDGKVATEKREFEFAVLPSLRSLTGEF